LKGEPDQRALHMAVFTLNKMTQGGIYDHLGGGFCRYSVDDEWMIPHFEKMLYDNGPLLALVAQAAVATNNASLERAARETAAWVMREMQSPEGGYYSSLQILCMAARRNQRLVRAARLRHLRPLLWT
jgi:uncharacterized protein YyaL (SSP411 family)